MMRTFLKFGLAPYSEYILHILFFMYQLRVYILYFWAMMQINSFKILLIFSFISFKFFCTKYFCSNFHNHASYCMFSCFAFKFQFMLYIFRVHLCNRMNKHLKNTHAYFYLDKVMNNTMLVFLISLHPGFK